MDDHGVVAVQIGRQPRSTVDVATRCHLDLPIVVVVPPLLDDGTPFPTRYWLSCPLAVLRVSRLESAGGVRAADERVRSDEEFAAGLGEANARYAAQRDALIPPQHEGPLPSGGVGGSAGGVKCLHAHYADHAAGNDNPVGEWVAPDVDPLNCVEACVIDANGAIVANPRWTEPPQSA